MIKYKLICKDCESTFDSWFASSKEFEKLKRKKLLNCHNCNSLKVDKSLMAPTLMNKNNLKLEKLDGMNFNIINDQWSVSSDTSINYIVKSIKL